MKKNHVTIGMKVTVIKEVEAFYSKYGGNPYLSIKPGVVGTVGAINVPVVRNTTGHDCYVCVDYLDVATGKVERASVYYDNLKEA